MTEEKTFEEQFPELKGKVDIYKVSERIPKSDSYFASAGMWIDIRQDEMQKSCLSKQRVKEAIERITPLESANGKKVDAIAWRESLIWLKKELEIER